MSTKHTPGPWFIDEQPHKSSAYYIRGSDEEGRRLTKGKGAVAHIPRSTVMPMEANARLIAQAPEMLATLEALQESAAYWSEYDVPIGIVERINEVIAKAKGDL